MVNYRRAREPGATYFFTVNLKDRKSDLLIQQMGLLRAAFRRARQRNPFVLDAVVVLPDHMHTIWTLPEGDADFPSRWKVIKSRFTLLLKTSGLPLSRNARGEYDVWQPRYWEHLIRNEEDYERHANYIHYNPVKHGLVARPADWRWSSVHRYIRLGVLPADWAVAGEKGSYGE